MRAKEYLAGMKAGLPICIGYLSVSFGFGAMAVAVAGSVCVFLTEQLLGLL